MADVKLNALVDGVSGKVGKNLVLRQRGGRTLLGTLPIRSLIISDRQKEFRERFSKATQYAKSILVVPEVRAEYESLVKDDEFMTPYTAAVKDFLTMPRVAMIDTETYLGKVGDKIIIRTDSDYKITSVKVSLLAADASIIETGVAVSTHPLRLEWQYTATQAVAALPGLKLVVTVFDRPGNETIREKLFG